MCGIIGCSCDRVAIWTGNREFSALSDVNLLFLGSVQDLEHILSKGLTWTFIEVSCLKEHLDVTELAEVEVTFLVESVILKLHLLNLSLELSGSCTTSGTTDGLGCTSGCCSARDSTGWNVCLGSRLWLLTHAHTSTLLGRGSTDLTSTKDVVKFLVLSPTDGVVWLTTVVLLEVSFQPLAELEVVLVSRLGELGDLDVTLNAILVEGSLENLVVFSEFVLVFGIPLNFTELESSGIECVHDGAVHGSGCALLDLGELKL